MKTNETGHYKNVVNLEKLKVFAEGLGTERVHVVHDAVKNQINTVSLCVDNRQLVFDNVKPSCTKIINIMGSTNVDPKTIEYAKFYNAKIQGTSTNKKEAPKESEDKSTSNSDSIQSYDSIYEQFKSLNNLLIQDGNYSPIESDVNNSSLTVKENEMLATNQDIIKKLDDLGKKCVLWNTTFYVGDTNLIAISRDFKKYIWGKWGVQSPEFVQIKNIIFKDLGIKK